MREAHAPHFLELDAQPPDREGMKADSDLGENEVGENEVGQDRRGQQWSAILGQGL